jgi:SulP family sulfate permease
MAAATSNKGVSSLQGELWGGLAAMLVALPSAIAFGVATYAPLGTGYVATGALAGILGAVALGIVAPLLGGAPRLISAPCAPAAAVMAALAAGLLAGGRSPLRPEAVPLLLTLVGLIAGVLQVLYGAVGGGRLIKYIPFPVVSGYLSGVAVLIFLSQVPRFFGLPKDAQGMHALLTPSLWKWQGMIVGGVTILAMLGAPRLTRKLPAPVVGLCGGLLAYFGLGLLDGNLLRLDHNPLVIGPIAEAGGSVLAGLVDRWRGLGLLTLATVKTLLVPALTLSALLSIDTLKTCVVVDALTRSRHRSNHELVGQGAGNIVSALVGGMPGAGTMGATLVNVGSGGTSRLSGVFEGVFSLVVFLVLSRLVGWVPIAALAGILIVVAFRMFDRTSFHLLKQRSTVLDFCVIAAVIIVAVGYSLMTAAGVGLALAIMLFIREQMRSSVIRRKLGGHQISSKKQRLPAEKEALLQAGRQTTVCELQGNLFFGTTDRLFTELEPDLKRSHTVILDMRRVQSVDFTAAHMLEQFEALLAERGAHLVFSSLPAQLPSGQDLEGYFHHLGIVRASKNVKIFSTLDDALEWTEDRTLEDLRQAAAEECRPLDLAEFELVREFEQDQTLEALRACVQERFLPAGAQVFRSGDASADLYLIRRGGVRISVALDSGKPLCLATFGRGHFFGDMAFLDRSPRSADALTTADTDLYVISRDRFDEVVHAQPLVGIKIFARLARVLATRLRHTDAELRALQDA